MEGPFWLRPAGIAFIIILFGNHLTSAQSLLPDISVINKNGQNYLSWTSGYNSISQIGVQRSMDSLYNYSTIGYVSAPNKKVNSYVDRKPYQGTNFYRLFIRLTNGAYFFSNPAKSVTAPPPPPDTTATPAVATGPYVFRPSIYVYTNPEGNVNISLTDLGKAHYGVKFFDDQGKPLFELNNIQQTPLILDKSNFMHAGWFHFELYEDGKLKEKSRFFIPNQWSE